MSRKFLVPVDLAQNELQNAKIQNLASAPASPVAGQVYFNSTSSKLFYYNGASWVDVSAGTTYSAGTGLTLTTGTFAIDPAYASFTNYYTKTQIDAGYQPLDGDLTAIAALAGTTGLIRKTAANTYSLDTATYLTANQSITLSGEASGTGTTAITITLANSAVIGKVLTGYTVGANTALAAADTILGAFQKVQGQLNAKANSATTLAGYGITDAQPLDADLTAIAALSANGLLRKTAGTWGMDSATYLTANQSITLSGDASGSGTTSIAVTIAAATVTGKALTGYAVGTNAALAATDTILGAFGKVQAQINAKANSATTLAGYGITDALASSLKGAANGLAELDATGKVPAAQLPSYVDDVLEYANLAAFPATGETAKIYVALDTNKIYRWSGSAYIEVSPTAGNADTATKLATARSITATSEVSWTVSFDGSANVSAAATVANSAVISKVLTGVNNESSAFTSILATDTVLQAFEKLQGQANWLAGNRARKVSQQIGDGTSTSFVVTHNFGTRDLVVSVRQSASPYATVECDIEMTDVNSFTVRFAVAPTSLQYTVVGVG